MLLHQALCSRCPPPLPQVERVIAERHFTNPDGSLTPKYLCKWRGLPYCEGTYETREDLEACGMAHMVDEYFVRP